MYNMYIMSYLRPRIERTRLKSIALLNINTSVYKYIFHVLPRQCYFEVTLSEEGVHWDFRFCGFGYF